MWSDLSVGFAPGSRSKHRCLCFYVKSHIFFPSDSYFKQKENTVIQCPTCSYMSVGLLCCHSVDVRTRHILGLAQSLSGAVTCHIFLDVAPLGLPRDPSPFILLSKTHLPDQCLDLQTCWRSQAGALFLSEVIRRAKVLSRDTSKLTEFL